MHIFNVDTDPLDLNFDYNPIETAALRGQTYANLKMEDLRRFALWKLDRVVDVPDALLADLRSLSGMNPLTARTPAAEQALNQLVACDGIGYPMASAFLKFIRPDVFPIIDVRAYRALTGKRLRSSQYTTKLYLDYADCVRDISLRRKVPLSVVDEQLYCYDKAHNGKINA